MQSFVRDGWSRLVESQARQRRDRWFGIGAAAAALLAIPYAAGVLAQISDPAFWGRALWSVLDAAHLLAGVLGLAAIAAAFLGPPKRRDRRLALGALLYGLGLLFQLALIALTTIHYRDDVTARALVSTCLRGAGWLLLFVGFATAAVALLRRPPGRYRVLAVALWLTVASFAIFSAHVLWMLVESSPVDDRLWEFISEFLSSLLLGASAAVAATAFLRYSKAQSPAHPRVFGRREVLLLGAAVVFVVGHLLSAWDYGWASLLDWTGGFGFWAHSGGALLYQLGRVVLGVCLAVGFWGSAKAMGRGGLRL